MEDDDPGHGILSAHRSFELLSTDGVTHLGHFQRHTAIERKGETSIKKHHLRATLWFASIVALLSAGSQLFASAAPAARGTGAPSRADSPIITFTPLMDTATAIPDGTGNFIGFPYAPALDGQIGGSCRFRRGAGLLNTCTPDKLRTKHRSLSGPI
jgi:hypothetical protein